MCESHLADDPSALCCQRTDEHETGHVYVSTSGVPNSPKEEA